MIRGGPNWVRDDDALQDQAVRVMTRDALASVSLVCILEQEGRQRYLADGSTFHPEAKPGKEELKAALRSTVRLSRQDVVRHFLGMEGHAMWRNTMLARHYPVVFRQQRYSMGNGKELRLDPQLGIVYEEEGAVS